ncbi:MAG: tRNA (adenosine(37)-N6)-threonylcarbamoyltransferase complex dimerization subunit type 1 TsaB [Elusimicrobia bacterium]|nr:tRNA (adenosine(37)-N6)-threonylcarbamoyltransferase complex dimerization subunit type 1 TsaB [Elusimicrobiota bacterium]
MLILGVDTAGEGVSLALGDGARVWALRRKARSAETVLWPALEALLGKAGKTLSELGGVACVTGPGRFTAVRLGVTFCDMLARSRGVPAVGLTRFEACAPTLAAKAEGPYALVVPSPREEAYLQLWRRSGRTVAAEAPPVWTAAGALDAAAGAAVRVDASAASARELLGPARRLLAARRRPALRPLYLKPANYAK